MDCLHNLLLYVVKIVDSVIIPHSEKSPPTGGENRVFLTHADLEVQIFCRFGTHAVLGTKTYLLELGILLNDQRHDALERPETRRQKVSP